MKPCEVCDTLAIYRQVWAMEEKSDSGRKRRHRITVALVEATWLEGLRSAGGRSTDYRRGGRGYALKYCPECGRQLSRKETEARI